MSITQRKQELIILSEAESKHILEMFPLSLKPYLEECNNPLDETQMLLNLFKKRNVRIILKKEKDEFGDDEWNGYFHCVDLAEKVNFNKDHIRDWNKNWKIEFFKYKNLAAPNARVKICEINKRTTNANANYINEQDLKKVLLKIKTKEAEVFQEWILKQATIMKKLIKKMIEIKHTLEAEQLKLQIEKHDEEKKQLTLKHEEDKKLFEEKITRKTKRALIKYKAPDNKQGVIYIASSESKMKRNEYKIGQTGRTGKARTKDMQTGDPTLECLAEFKCTNVVLAEAHLHKMLEHLRVYSNREFFSVSSLETCKSIVKKVVDFVNENDKEYGMDYKTLQNIYIGIADDIPKMICDKKEAEAEEEEEEDIDIYKQYLDTRTKESKKHILIRDLYEDFKSWHQTNNPNKKVPDKKEFVKEIREYHTVNDRVRVGTSVSTGILNLCIIE